MSDRCHDTARCGPDELQRADSVIFTIIGGEQLSLGEAKRALDLAASQLDKSAERRVLLGAGTSPLWNDMIQITALTVRYTDQKPEIAASVETPVRRAASVRRNVSGGADSAFVQQTLDLDTIDKGIMENSTPDLYNGEDLDIPTFKRHNIFIDPGK